MDDVITFPPPVYTETMDMVMITQKFEYAIQKWIDLKTQQYKNGTI